MDMSTIDPMWIWVAVAVTLFLGILFMFTRGSRRSKTAQLRERFGAEYDHAVKRAGNRTRAEEELAVRAQEAESITVRPLNAAEREHYRVEWTRVETRFLERPTSAVVEAEELINELMRLEGYPMGDFDKHATLLAVKHPRVVEHYRAGHAAIDADRDGKSSTEELRQALLHYRELFNELLAVRDTNAPDVPIARLGRPAAAVARDSELRVVPESEKPDPV